MAALPLILSAGSAWGACVLNMVKGETPSAGPGIVRVSAHGLPAVPSGYLRVIFAGHSSFFFETPGGATLFTDYNARNLPPALPDIVTMSNPHPTHSVRGLDSGGVKVFLGWNPKGGKAKVDFRLKDARIFNIPTNPTDIDGQKYYINSIFVIEVAGLCVAHLGNLNYLLGQETLDRLGRIDVLFIPIGTIGALSPPDAIKVIQQVRPPLVIPMHFDTTGPNAFAALAKDLFPLKIFNGNHMMLNRKDLPNKTEIMFMIVAGAPAGE